MHENTPLIQLIVAERLRRADEDRLARQVRCCARRSLVDRITRRR